MGSDPAVGAQPRPGEVRLVVTDADSSVVARPPPAASLPGQTAARPWRARHAEWLRVGFAWGNPSCAEAVQRNLGGVGDLDDSRVKADGDASGGGLPLPPWPGSGTLQSTE